MRGVGLANMTFLYNSGHCMYFLLETKLTHPTLCGVASWQKCKNNVLCIYLTFHTVSIKLIFSDIATNPLIHGSGVAKPQFSAFLDLLCIFKKPLFSDLIPSFTCWRENSIIPQRAHFQLLFIRNVRLVFWKLFLEDFNRYLGQQYAT